MNPREDFPCIPSIDPVTHQFNPFAVQQRADQIKAVTLRVHALLAEGRISDHDYREWMLSNELYIPAHHKIAPFPPAPES